MDSQPNKPSVFEFLDAVSYLRSYYEFRKRAAEGFSYESWAQELELNNRSFLRLAVTGKKKLSPRLVQAISRNNFGTKAEENYFRCLVAHALASTSKEKQFYSSEMLKILRHENQAQVIHDEEVQISDPLLPRLLSILSFADVRASVDYCAKLLKVDATTIERTLEKLESMGLIEKRIENKMTIWSSRSDVFHIPDNFGSINLLHFHAKSLKEAIEAFEQPQNLRKYKSLFLAMDEEAMADFVRVMDDFIAEQLFRFNSKTFQGKRMFQINFNIHPVSEKSALQTN